MKNAEVSRIFREIAAILEIKGENVFRVRAYERAAGVIDGLSEDLGEMAASGRLTDIPGIGKDLAGKISEIVATGTCAAYEALRKEIPPGLLAMTAIPGVGPRTARMLYDRLGVSGVDGLEQAIREGKLKGVRGIKEKTIERIVKGIALLKKGRERMPLAEALSLASRFTCALRNLSFAGKVSEAGSLRRLRETVRDIDILVCSSEPEKVMEAFTTLPWVSQVTARGATKSSVRTAEGMQVDCRVVEERSFGAALVYFTGSKDFNIRLRAMAVKKGWKVNEYGVYRGSTLLAGRTEEEIFSLFGMEYIPPELREDTGEITLALEHRLPRLLELKDIRGDLHCHSIWSDGGSSIEEMAKKARSLGYSYLAVTDHSQSLKIARGLDRKALSAKKREIEKLNSGYKDFRILFGTEADIGPEGELDYPEELLKGFDIVVAAVHTGFRQSKAQMTRRIIAACRNPCVHIIAHPTGRLWGEREGYEADFTEIINAAADTNTALEINAYPNRLDLNDQYARQAKNRGCRLSVDTDSHVAAHMDNMKLGVSVARRGWLEPGDVINTLPCAKLLASLSKR